MKCIDILKYGRPDDIVKLPSETAHNKKRKQGGWQIHSNCVKKLARGHSRRYEEMVAEEKQKRHYCRLWGLMMLSRGGLVQT